MAASTWGMVQELSSSRPVFVDATLTNKFRSSLLESCSQTDHEFGDDSLEDVPETLSILIDAMSIPAFDTDILMSSSVTSPGTWASRRENGCAHAKLEFKEYRSC